MSQIRQDELRGPPVRTFLRSSVIGFVGLLSALYLLNPTAGVFELIPDNFPVVGNLDEATATAVLLACLGHFGIDLTAWLRGGRK